MGNVTSIATPFEQPFDDIIIHAMPTGSKCVSITRAVNVDGHAIFQDDKGRLYSTRIRKGAHYGLTEWGFTPSLIKGLIALGKITRKQGEQWAAAAKQGSTRSDARSDLGMLDHVIKKHGLKIAARERAKLVKAAGLKEAA